MTKADALPYAGEDRRRMLARLAEDDFLPPREPREPAESPAGSPSPPERALKSAVKWSPQNNPHWQVILQQAARDRRAREWKEFWETAGKLSWVPMVVIGLVLGIVLEARKGPRSPYKSPTVTFPKQPGVTFPNQPIVIDERAAIEQYKASNRKAKKIYGPGKGPPPNSPVPSEAIAALLGLSKAARQELRDDWFAPNPVDDDQP